MMRSGVHGSALPGFSTSGSSARSPAPTASARRANCSAAPRRARRCGEETDDMPRVLPAAVEHRQIEAARQAAQHRAHLAAARRARSACCAAPLLTACRSSPSLARHSRCGVCIGRSPIERQRSFRKCSAALAAHLDEPLERQMRQQPDAPQPAARAADRAGSSPRFAWLISTNGSPCEMRRHERGRDC